MKIFIYISILLIGSQLPAQKKVLKEIAFNSQKVVIQLQDIDQLEFFHHDVQKVIIIMEDYEENPVNLAIRESRESIEISSSVLALLRPQVKTDKFCKEQPLFPSYKIMLPKETEISLYYNDGNFKAVKFMGNLTLKLNRGNVELDDFKGDIDIELFSGNINSRIENGVIDIISTKGSIATNMKSKDLKQTATSLKGVFGRSTSNFKVRTIQANITLNTDLTQ